MASHGGKEDTPRPILDRKRYADNWEAIYGKKTKEETPKQPTKDKEAD